MTCACKVPPAKVQGGVGVSHRQGTCNALPVGNCWAYSPQKILVLKDATYTVGCSVTPIVTRISVLRICVGSARVCVCAANMRMSVASVFMLKFLDVRVSLLLFGSARKARQAKKKAQTDRNRGR